MERLGTQPDLYVAIAQVNNGGHGPWPAVLIVTEDPDKAVWAARFTGPLGYDIDWSDTNIRVDRIRRDEPVSRGNYARVIAFSRGTKDDAGNIREFFWDRELAERFQMTVSRDHGEPSVPLPE